jgi:hypothetical protein
MNVLYLKQQQQQQHVPLDTGSREQQAAAGLWLLR